MKLSPLLAQYLMVNRRLSLAGIGHFTAENSPAPVDATTKEKTGFLNIRFEANTQTKVDPDLIQFIGKETGKMKSLAEADLQSYLDQVREFLNIGKPFLIEGVGTLNKMKSGQIEFSQGQPVLEKMRDHSQTDKDGMAVAGEEPSLDYSDILGARKPSQNARYRWVFGLLVLAGVGLAVWGGYTLYKKSQRGNESEQTNASANTNTTGTTRPVEQNPADSLPPQTTPVSSNPVAGTSTYKFVVREAPLRQAMYRYKFLKDSCRLDVHLSTADSLTYQVFFKLNALPSDTARIADSLGLLYVSKGYPRVRIQKY